jgi:hypothetical protein
LGKSSGCCCCFWLEVEHTDELKGLCVSLGLHINPLLLYFLLLNKKQKKGGLNRLLMFNVV